MEKTMDKIVALAKARGFVYPGSEIYGGLANTWDYGNLGVELKNICKVVFAAGRAWNFMLSDKICHLFLRPGIYAAFNGNVVFCTEVLDQLVCAETLMTFAAVHKRVRKSAKMSRCHPCLRIH